MQNLPHGTPPALVKLAEEDGLNAKQVDDLMTAAQIMEPRPESVEEWRWLHDLVIAIAGMSNISIKGLDE